MMISVIICTYNRSALLEKSIASLLVQTYPKEEYEIIVVDNNSTDDTKEVVSHLMNASTVKLSYIVEQKLGLSYARNSGIENSLGDIVAFIDDDAEAEPDWLVHLVDAFSNDIKVYCAGGVVEGIWPIPRPEWLPDWCLDYLSVRDFRVLKNLKEFKYPNYPIGTNIAFRRITFEEFGGFCESLGRTGNVLLSNEEIELCLRIESAGKVISFVPSAKVSHHIMIERLNKTWFLQRFFSQGASEAILDMLSGRDVALRMKHYAVAIFDYYKDEEDSFSINCRYNESLGYVANILENSISMTQKDEFLTVTNKIMKSLYNAHTDQLRLVETERVYYKYRVEQIRKTFIYRAYIRLKKILRLTK